MAKTLTILNLLTILSLLLSLPHLQTSLSFEGGEIEGEYYLLDSPAPTTNAARSRTSRFLASAAVKKGASCGAATASHHSVVACNGVRANNGTCLLYCCKKHCRNVLGDHNNCGVCGHKCHFAERCCGGVCTNVLGNDANCGGCGRKCPSGVKCDFGYCGYA